MLFLFVVCKRRGISNGNRSAFHEIARKYGMATMAWKLSFDRDFMIKAVVPDSVYRLRRRMFLRGFVYEKCWFEKLTNTTDYSLKRPGKMIETACMRRQIMHGNLNLKECKAKHMHASMLATNVQRLESGMEGGLKNFEYPKWYIKWRMRPFRDEEGPLESSKASSVGG